MPKIKHGMYGTRPYRIWQQLKARCDYVYPKSRGAQSYKAKGITYTEK